MGKEKYSWDYLDNCLLILVLNDFEGGRENGRREGRKGGLEEKESR